MTTRFWRGFPFKDLLKLTLLTVFGAVVLAGCGQKDVSSSEDSSQEKESSGNPLTAPVDYLGAVGNSQKTAEKTTALAGLEQAIKMFKVQEARWPKDLNELVGGDYLPRLPEAPRGMKFDYNPQTGVITLVSQ